MASQYEEKATTAIVDQSAALLKCVSLFKSAKNDNERFASLLLVTRVVKSNDINGSQRRDLFDAIGFTFINRLLNTKSIPEDCSGGVYQSLAIAILACFATDEELVLHPQMVSKIIVLNQIISNPSNEKPFVDDAYQILISFSTTLRGSEVLLHKETVQYLCEIIVKDIYTPDMAWNVLLNIAAFIPKEMWSKHPKDLVRLLCFSADKIKTLQDMNKFTTCKHLLVLLSNAEAAAFDEALKVLDTDQWVVDLCVGLSEILQGKVTTIQRDPALILISVVSDLLGCGLKWIFHHENQTQTSSFFTFIVTSVSIEVRMILDDNNTEEILQKSTLLTACYNILEHVIAYLITMTDEEDNHNLAAEGNNLDQGMASKLYTQVTEAMMSILGFLQQGAIKYDAEEISIEEEHLVIASARVMCAWLAEESMALQKEVNKVLPFLIRLAKDTMILDAEGAQAKAVKTVTFQEPMETDGPPGIQPIEMMPFLLPAMCHFSAHDDSRKILVDNHTHLILAQYYSILYKRSLKDPATSLNSNTSLVTLLGVLLNFAVTEPNLVKEDKSFLEIQSNIVLNLPKILQSERNVVVVAHLVVLGIMLTRHQKESKDFSNPELRQFFNSSIHFLKQGNKCLCSAETLSPRSVACETDWKNISELWFLGVQVLTACVEQFQGLGALVKESGWLGNIELDTKGHQKQDQGVDKDNYAALVGLKNAIKI